MRGLVPERGVCGFGRTVLGWQEGGATPPALMRGCTRGAHRARPAPTLMMGTRALKMMSGRLRTALPACSLALTSFSMGANSSRCSMVNPVGQAGGTAGGGGWE